MSSKKPTPLAARPERSVEYRRNPPPWMNFTQLAAYLGCSAKTVRNYARMGMPYSPIGGENKVKLEKFWAWFDDHEVREDEESEAFAARVVGRIRRHGR